MLPGQRLLRCAFPNSFEEGSDAEIMSGCSSRPVGARGLPKAMAWFLLVESEQFHLFTGWRGQRMRKSEALLAELTERLRLVEPFVLLFSGGVDSSVLAAVAKRASLRFALLFADSALVPRRQLKRARDIAEELDIALHILPNPALSEPLFRANPPERCYICRQHICRLAKSLADRFGYANIVDGTNSDDLNDFRPGIKASYEAGVIHPFLDIGAAKKEVRTLAAFLNLPNADDYPEACLASRFAAGLGINEGLLKRVERAEDYLLSLSFVGCRVRCHGDLARIELRTAGDLRRITGRIRRLITRKLREIGFRFVTLDLQGYRSAGSHKD